MEGLLMLSGGKKAVQVDRNHPIDGKTGVLLNASTALEIDVAMIALTKVRKNEFFGMRRNPYLSHSRHTHKK
jgi:hypothetical protein